MGGPIGALIGFAIGSVLDSRSGSVESQFGRGPSDSSRTTAEGVGDFGLALLVLTAVVMKADGKVLKSELDYVKDVLKKSFGLEKARQLTLMLREVINKDIDPQGVCRQIADNMNVAGRRELLHLLFGIALADGTMGAAELDCLKELARLLRIPQSDFDSIRAMYGQTTEDAYTVLEVSPSATDEELKKHTVEWPPNITPIKWLTWGRKRKRPPMRNSSSSIRHGIKSAASAVHPYNGRRVSKSAGW